MKIQIRAQFDVVPPPFSVFENGGRLGGGPCTNAPLRKFLDTQKNYIVIQRLLRSNFGQDYEHTEWPMSFSTTNMPLGIMWWIFARRVKKLIIELDGSQHLEQEEYDAERTEFLKSKGYKVLRFWNNDVMNDIDSVLNVIWDTLNH